MAEPHPFGRARHRGRRRAERVRLGRHAAVLRHNHRHPAGGDPGGRRFVRAIPEIVQKGPALDRDGLLLNAATGAQQPARASEAASSRPRSDGDYLTNHHVVARTPADRGRARPPEPHGEVTATDPRPHLAVIRVERTGLPAAEFHKFTPHRWAIWPSSSAARSDLRRRRPPASSPGFTARSRAPRPRRARWIRSRPSERVSVAEPGIER